MIDKFENKKSKDEFPLEIHLCAYNNEIFIEDYIKSLKYQINKDIKLAFLNDGSIDNTLSIVTGIYKRYRFYR